MTITIATLIAAGLAPTQARLFADPLAWACDRFDLLTPLRQAGLVGQCRVESVDFTKLEESLRYTTIKRVREVYPSRIKSDMDALPLLKHPEKLANRVYSNRMGNGDEASGDGWRFRGRGLIQLTGRDNYTAFGLAFGGRPAEIVAEKMVDDLIGMSCMTAAWFFAVHASCGPLADASDWDAITRRVNGPRGLEAPLRRQYSQQALEAFK